MTLAVALVPPLTQATIAPLRRRCVNTAGQGWEVTCTVWEDGRRLAVDVDTSDYPYPLVLMRGLWQVDPHPHGSRILMRFAFRAAPSIRGGLFSFALRVLFPLALRRILDDWQRLAVRPAHPGPGSTRRRNPPHRDGVTFGSGTAPDRTPGLPPSR